MTGKGLFGGYGSVLAAAAILAGAMTWAFWPRPITVDMASASDGPFQVTLDADGKTRVRESYQISAPVAGRMLRVTVHAGDTITANKTVLARIEPTDPGFLDFRSRSQAEAAVKAAEAARSLAEAELARTRAERDYAESELKRARVLAAKGTISESALDRAERDARTKSAQVAAAEAALRVRAFELETARASLIDPSATAGTPPSCCVSVRAPVSGQVLLVLKEDAGVVAAGTPLIDIGDPTDLEIVTDLLSEDAVAVTPGADVLIEHWGGPGTLTGKVRRIEPYGFTKVSALGVEEQRVNVLIDITAPGETWSRLGHGFRVKTRIITYRKDKALQVPLGALFRSGDDWAVFVVKDGRARLQRVRLGHRNAHTAEILDGLSAGDTVVMHPGDRVEDGTRVAPRPI